MRAIWVNILSTISTSLDTKINPHDLDTLATTRLLEEDGWEVWLQEPFLRKKLNSSWKNKISRDQITNFDADLVILNAGYFVFDYLRSKFDGEFKNNNRRGVDFAKTIEWLSKFEGEILVFSNDPRETFQNIWSYEDHKLNDNWYFIEFMKIINKSRIICASKDILPEQVQHRAIECDYWKVIDVDILPLEDEPHWGSVYVGVKAQNNQRKKLIKNWMDDSSKCFTAGNIKINGLDSLTNWKTCNLYDVDIFTRYSSTTLVCGEPKHTWLTPRIIKAFCGGSIASIHPDYNNHYINDQIMNDQIVSMFSNFDHSLHSAEIYNRQTDFIRDLRNDYRKLVL